MQYARTKLYEWNAHEISYKLISFLFSLDKPFLTYGGGKWRMMVEKARLTTFNVGEAVLCTCIVLSD